ncbi:unnamed protein product, partial [Thelazia callipaeda]|uniref:PTPRZ phosphatase n=1 Tax=Thelazia callipaeda TaxID=103827 RepID=A0A0N5CSX4_THECL
ILLTNYFLGENESRILYHRHWTTWPDHGAPTTVMVPFSLLQSAREQKRPVVVHCSAGIGRTGTLVLSVHVFVVVISAYYSSLKRGSFPNSNDYMQTLRANRAGAVQTEDQYAYSHYVVVRLLYAKKVYTSKDISGNQIFHLDSFFSQYIHFLLHGNLPVQATESIPQKIAIYQEKKTAPKKINTFEVQELLAVHNTQLTSSKFEKFENKTAQESELEPLKVSSTEKRD